MLSSIGNGGVSAFENTSMPLTQTSIAPVGSLSLTLPPRERTSPVTPMHHSERSVPATTCAGASNSGSNTSWVRPSRSRRSMNTQPP